MEGSSIQKELLKYTDYDSQAASDSAFCQQRKKIRPEAFISLFHRIYTIITMQKVHTKGIGFWHVMAQNLCTSIISDNKKYMPHGRFFKF